MKEDQKLVSVARFEEEFEAQAARAVLEEEGIHAVIFGEVLGGALPFSSAGQQAFIELQVFEEDRARAEQIIEATFAASGEADPDEDADFDTEEGEGPIDE